MKGFPAKHIRLEISHRSLMHHSSYDIGMYAGIYAYVYVFMYI